MKEIIEHFAKLLPCEQFLVTGSYALSRLGLYFQRVKDLDIILVNPKPESLEILKSLTIPRSEGYPPDEGHFRLRWPNEGNTFDVDFFIKSSHQESIILYDGIALSTPVDLVKEKKRYKGLKHLLQLKTIAEIFYQHEDLIKFLMDEQGKYQGEKAAFEVLNMKSKK